MDNQNLPDSAATARSDEFVSKTIRDGMERAAISTGVGLVLGTMAGIVLIRGGRSGSSTARKVITGFGAGIGLGSAWTQCSIQLESKLEPYGHKKGSTTP